MIHSSNVRPVGVTITLSSFKQRACGPFLDRINQTSCSVIQKVTRDTLWRNPKRITDLDGASLT